ncbi:MAG: hypothetical protein WC579_01495 [Candidatus Paceibacterota bacterium]
MKLDIYQLKKLIEITLKKLGDKFYSKKAVDLLLRTAIVESNAKYIYQLGNAPARGFFQIEPATAKSIYDNFLLYRPELLERINEIVGIGWHKDLDYKLSSDIGLGIILARLKYYPNPTPIPDDLAGQAYYWKKNYNTEKGAGSIEKFIKICEEMGC